MQTVGMLIDQLQIVSLKHHFADTDEKKESTRAQVEILSAEVNQLLFMALDGSIPVTFAANKVYKKVQEVVGDPDESMTFGELVAGLAKINLSMWVTQDDIYGMPEDISLEDFRSLLSRGTALNIERNQWIDAVDRSLEELIKGRED